MADDLITYGNENAIIPIVEDDRLPTKVPVEFNASNNQMVQIMALVPVAHQYPRSESEALKRILAAADESWWWKVPNRGEGLSVKCARSAIRHYKNVTVIPMVEEITIQMQNRGGGYVPGWRLTALAIDLENIVIETTTATCAKPEPLPGEKPLAYEQRCLQQQLAFAGRIERNAIMKLLPGEWQSQIKNAIFAKMKLKPLAERITETVKACADFEISESQLEKLTGVKPVMWSEAQWADVRGRLNAVRNGEIKAKDAFSPDGESETAETVPQPRKKA